MKSFSHDGVCLFGKHKGSHASALPKLWVEWAKANVEGFAAAYATALTRQPSPPPTRPRPAGRRYILKPFRKPIQ